MPDTLLLAEAFWLMEGYFVRTLGMHRVYNSAWLVDTDGTVTHYTYDVSGAPETPPDRSAAMT